MKRTFMLLVGAALSLVLLCGSGFGTLSSTIRSWFTVPESLAAPMQNLRSDVARMEHQSSLANDGAVEAVRIDFSEEPSSDPTIISNQTLAVDEAEPQTSQPSAGVRFSERLESIGARAKQIAGDYLRVNDWVIVGTRRVSSDAVKATVAKVFQSTLASSDSANPWIWEVSAASIRAELSRNPWIEDVKMTWKQFPTSAELSIHEAEPWFIAVIGGHSWVVSRKGRLIQPLESIEERNLGFELSALPRLSGLDGLSGQTQTSVTSSRFNQALSLMQILESQGGFPFHVERYSLLPEGGLEVLPADVGIPKVLISALDSEQALHRLNNLTAVLKDIEQRRELAHTIDLRFEGQALVR